MNPTRLSHHTTSRDELAELGHRLKSLRSQRGLTIRQMAALMGVVPGTLLRLEKGDPGISLGVLSAALHVLGVDDRMSLLALHDQVAGAGSTAPKQSIPLRRVAGNGELTYQPIRSQPVFDPCFD